MVPLVAYIVIAFFAFRALGARLTHMPDEENELSPHGPKPWVAASERQP